jgi:RNA polymerase sigma-70 factor (ECF subfamily)
MERERLEQFVRQDYARVLAALAFACGDRGRAEDALQEALATAWQQRWPIDDLRAWVTKAALNQARSKGRRLGAERRAHERAAQFRPERAAAAPAPLDGLLDAALRRLPARQREIVVLHYLLDLSVVDVAATLGVTPGTVKTQLHRAREALRARLTNDAEEEADHVG